MVHGPSNVIPFRWRPRLWRPRKSRRRSHARRFRPNRRKPFPLAAPLLILAVAFFGWAVFASQAPAVAGAWWDAAVHFVESGEWQSPPSAPAYLDVSAGAGGGDAALTGRASVIDADTLEIRATRIRLHAVDAPESSQRCYAGGEALRCGQRAANALDGWIGGRTVACIGLDIDRYGRTVATCSVGGEDVGRWLVRNGHAVAYRDYGDDYICDEADAARAGRGIWASEFIAPWQWRRLPDDQQDGRPNGRYNPGWPDECR